MKAFLWVLAAGLITAVGYLSFMTPKGRRGLSRAWDEHGEGFTYEVVRWVLTLLGGLGDGWVGALVRK
jgi:hypothetical protein